MLDGSNRKPNKILSDKGSEFCNRSTKSWLEKNAIEMHSIQNQIKSVDGERFIRNVQNTFINTWLQYQKICPLIN